MSQGKFSSPRPHREEEREIEKAYRDLTRKSGNEGDGISPLVRKNCDVMVNIPMRGRISSLNASAAASILLYEAVRQRV